MTETITQLGGAISGTVLTPSTPGYDAARAMWNARVDRRPALVVQCRTAEDVQAAVRFARAQRLGLSVKGGGHSFAAHTVADGGVLIDLSPMGAIAVDPGAKRVRVEPGVRWRELDAASQRHGLAAVGGTVSSIGIGGFVLGGGNGYLSRRHGMAVDNLLSADVVTADGELVRASDRDHADLFWAIRGGGGNFGVVTAFELQLHAVGPTVLAGQIVHRFADAATVLRRYRDVMNEAPDEMQCYAFLMKVPPLPEFPQAFHGQPAVDLVVFHADPSREHELQPLRELDDPILSVVAAQPYVAVQQAFDAALPAGQRWESRAHQLAALSDDAIDACLAHVGELPGAFTSVYVASETGAIGRTDPSATAYPHRAAPYSIHALAGWTDPADDAGIAAWVRRMHDAMTPFATGGVYVNTLGTDESSRVPAAYGGNWDRLRGVKQQWDPENVFRGNHNIAPRR